MWILIGVLLAAVIASGAGILVIASVRFKRAARSMATEIAGQAHSNNASPVSESDLKGLPAPVQRWLRYAGVVGKEKPATVRVTQRGHFRQSRKHSWIPFEAEQTYSINPPAFVWRADMRASKWIRIRGRDSYRDGKGHMLIKLWSLLTVADARGMEINQGAMTRYLNEMMWYPTAALCDYVVWEPMDDTHARATMTDGGMSASAVFEWDDVGKLVTMTAERFMSTGNGFSLERWSTPILEYGEKGGLKIPTRGKGVWHLADGEFSYIHVEITDISYDSLDTR